MSSNNNDSKPQKKPQPPPPPRPTVTHLEHMTESYDPRRKKPKKD